MLETIIALARVFRAQRYELYMVGGCVRDLLLRRESPPDIDLTTDARPDDIKRLVAQTGPLSVVTVGEAFGTIAAQYPRAESAPAENGVPALEPSFTSLTGNYPGGVDVVEITTYRSDIYRGDSRKPEVTFGDTLEGDLLRRDFTINAMARDPLTGDIVDPWGGRADLERGLIRAVGDDPHSRFDEDPLRMLRAVRFSAQLGFQIEPATAAAIRAQAATLVKISNERIRDEMVKALVSPRPDAALRMLVDLGLAQWALPELLELRGVSQQPAHSKDVFEHVMRVVAGTPARPALRWGALLHDIAKPRTRTVDDGKVHFFGHEDVGAVMARDILRRLRHDRPFIEFVSKLVRMHMRVNAYLPDWTDGAVRRLMLDAGEALPDLLDLSRADITSYRPEKVARAVARVNELEARCVWLREEAERVPIRSPLDGNDLMALFGREPGPWLRVVKDRLLSLVIDGDLAPDDRERATEIARETLAGLDETPPQARAPRRAPLPPTERGGKREQPAERPPEGPGGRDVRLASRRKSREAVDSSTESRASERPKRASSSMNRAATRRHSVRQAPRAPRAADRDEMTRYLNDYLDITRFRDVAPNGMQVIGKPEIRRVALGVSANLALIEEAAARGADLLICHHGLFTDRDPRPILAREKRRLQALFAGDMTLLGYHLPLDAHHEVGNNVLWLRRLGFAVDSLDFAVWNGQAIGAIGAVEGEPIPLEELVGRVSAIAGGAPRVYAFGPERVGRLAVSTGAAPGSLAEAVARGCDAYLTGETSEGTQAFAREGEANFIAAGHYNTERLGVQALGDLLRDRFGVETFFIEIPNDV
ncbi:MAG TPA: Nif3-like dinuclear metal center hexameric protein [Ktedonobacterales bacterium]